MQIMKKWPKINCTLCSGTFNKTSPKNGFYQATSPRGC